MLGLKRRAVKLVSIDYRNKNFMKKKSIIFLDWHRTLCWTHFWGSIRSVDSEDFILGQMKEGETFLACSREYQIPIHQTFLIDDSIQTCEFFASLGGRSYAVLKGKDETLEFMEDAFQRCLFF